MNVALFIPNIKAVCGRSAVGKSLATQLLKKGISVFLITNEESDISFCQDINIPVLILPCNPDKKSIHSMFESVVRLFEFVKKNKIEIINPHHRYLEFISLLMRAIYKQKIKIITTVHSQTTDYKILSYRGDALITVSMFIKNHLIKKYGKDDKKIELIFNGIERNNSMVQGIRERNSKIILGFGRFEYEKGFDLLIHAVALNKDKLGTYNLVLAGEGSNESELAELALQLGVSVSFVKSASTPWELIHSAEIIAVPSRIESLGLVILEAGLAGKCVIASDVGGIPEIIEDNVSGLLFESENIQKLADSMEKAVMDKPYAEMLGIALKEKVEEKFSMYEMINKYVYLFDKFAISLKGN